MKVMNDPGDFLPSGVAIHKAASDDELKQIAQQVEQGLKQGAVAVGFSTAYTAWSDGLGNVGSFPHAARYKASVHVHLRSARDKSLESIDEVLGPAAITGRASAHRSFEQLGNRVYAAATLHSCRSPFTWHGCDDRVLSLYSRNDQNRFSDLQ
jgi:hypothetical protein